MADCSLVLERALGSDREAYTHRVRCRTVAGRWQRPKRLVFSAAPDGTFNSAIIHNTQCMAGVGRTLPCLPSSTSAGRLLPSTDQHSASITSDGAGTLSSRSQPCRRWQR